MRLCFWFMSHKWGKWATNTQAGAQARVCVRCNKAETRSVVYLELFKEKP